MLKQWKRTLALLGVAAAVGLVSAGLALGKKPPKPPPEPPPSGPGLIAFYDEDFGVAMMNPDGSGYTPVAVGGIGNAWPARPAWSHAFSDGTVKLGWVEVDSETSKSSIAVVDVSPMIGMPTKVSSVQTNSTKGPWGPLDWSPPVLREDGTESVRVCFGDLFTHLDGDWRWDVRVVTLIYDPQSGAFTVDPNTPPVIFDAGFNCSYGTANGRFSPDGNWLALVHEVIGPDGYLINTTIWVGKSDGSQPPFKVIDGVGSYDGAPAWSPDGNQLAFVSDRNARDYDLDIYIASLKPDKSLDSTERMTSRNKTTRAGLTWSPDGLQISYAHYGKKRFAPEQIGKVILLTGETFTLTGPDNNYPDWSPMDLPPLP